MVAAWLAASWWRVRCARARSSFSFTPSSGTTVLVLTRGRQKENSRQAAASGRRAVVILATVYTHSYEPASVTFNDF